MRVVTHRLFWPIVLLAVLFLVNLIAFPGFFRIEIKDGHLFGSLIDILRNGAPTLIVAVGMTLVIATRGIDLSVGATVAIAGSVACMWIAGAPDPTAPSAAVVAVLLALGLSLVLGAWNGLLVALFGIQPIIATLVLMTAGRGLAMLITDGQIITVANPLFAELGGGFLLGLPVSVVLAAVVFVATALLTRRTALGMLIESVGINPTASRLAGVRSRNLIILAYAFSGLCSGIAGLIISSGINGADGNNAGLWFELDAILAVVIGGTALRGGRYFLAGTLVGALLIQTLTTTIYSIGVPPETTLLFKALVVTLVCLVQSPAFRAKLMQPRRRRVSSGDRPPPGAQPPERAVDVPA